jgi:hypothetical protein
MKSFLVTMFLVLGCSYNAIAGNVLFVNNGGSDPAVPAALAADGHIITSANVGTSPPGAANTYFQGVNLNQYCAVVWSAAYQYSEQLTGATNALSPWVVNGGHLLILTPDGIRGSGSLPRGQLDLVGLVGGYAGTDSGTNLSTIPNVLNSLTVGVVDIRGLQPPNVSDMDSLCGPLSADTTGLVTSQSSGCGSVPGATATGYAWTLRNLGYGQVAFITSGNFSGQYASPAGDPDWASTSIPGAGVYNAGLRNFVKNSCEARPVAPVPASGNWVQIMMALALVLTGVWYTLRSRN